MVKNKLISKTSTFYAFFSVNKLVSQTSLQVAVYTGQLDIIVNTLGKYNTGIYRNALKKVIFTQYFFLYFIYKT